MFGSKKEEVVIPQKSFFKGVKKLILVTALLVGGVLVTLSGYGLIQFNPMLLKYTGLGLLGLALIYHFLY